MHDAQDEKQCGSLKIFSPGSGKEHPAAEH